MAKKGAKQNSELAGEPIFVNRGREYKAEFLTADNARCPLCPFVAHKPDSRWSNYSQ